MIWITDSLHLSYFQYYICDFDVSPDVETLFKIHHGNSLVAAGPGHLTVMGGTHTGNVRLTIDECDVEPTLNLEAWEVVVDISHYSTNGETCLMQWGANAVLDAGVLSHVGRGWYRVRVQARGRDEAMKHSTVLGEPIEEHAIGIWPAPPAPEHVHKIGDNFGRGIWDSSSPPTPPVYPELEDDEI
ncbi:hypothetical protein [Protofrankia coriariae]|uniref:hypothetical protein n=1 Tax=Protofrankia coriariae TaxID=1562887 RepID=UPI0012F673A1|nr:hypothetical protein [Protofrankia coriariae]